MNTEKTTYNRNERIGRMATRIVLYARLSERTAIGGEKITWAEWVTVWAYVENKRGEEVYAADRRTAFNTKKFVCRKAAVAGVKERMVLEYFDELYDIERIDELETAPPRAYVEITATRRDETITVVELPDTPESTGFVEKNVDFSGFEWVLTNGILPNPLTTPEDTIHKRCYLYRSGLRQIYGVDYTIEPGNVLKFMLKCREEVLLYYQYNIS